jgi:hypothetical protein
MRLEYREGMNFIIASFAQIHIALFAKDINDCTRGLTVIYIPWAKDITCIVIHE